MSSIADQNEEFATALVIHYFTGGTLDDSVSVPADGVPEDAVALLRHTMLSATDSARDFWTHKIKRDAAIVRIVETGIEEDEAARLFSFAHQKIKKAIKGEIPLPRPPVLSTKPWWKFW